MMKRDIIEVISRYMDIDAEALDVKITETESEMCIRDRVIVIVPILSEGIVVEKTQYVSREKWSGKEYLFEDGGRCSQAG